MDTPLKSRRSLLSGSGFVREHPEHDATSPAAVHLIEIEPGDLQVGHRVAQQMIGLKPDAERFRGARERTGDRVGRRPVIGKDVAVTYEAGPTGFGLARFLLAAGVVCLVAAPATMASMPVS